MATHSYPRGGYISQLHRFLPALGGQPMRAGVVLPDVAERGLALH